MEMEIIIIGAGMAGMTAAIYLARAGKKVLVLEKSVPGGQIINSLRVENWPGDFGVSGKDLMDKVYKQMTGLGAELRYEDVLSVSGEGDGFKVVTSDGEYLSKVVIIAVGTEPRKISEKQKESAGDRPISYCATCDGALYKNKTVVVIGSGNTAKHEAKYLEGICKKVLRIHHDEPIPEEAEAVFVAIGRVPATDIFKDLVDLNEEGFIVADENCRTSRANVFAVGDCRVKNVKQLVTAASDGAVVAKTVVELFSK